MALQKQSVTFTFSQGLETKLDSNTLPAGKFTQLENSVFNEIGALKKRNGFPYITQLPDASSTYLTTFNGALTAIGTKMQALSDRANLWVNKGSLQPTDVSVLSLIKNSINQNYVDTAFSPNGLVCTAYRELQTIGTTTIANVNVFKYAVADATTGQNIVPPTVLTSPLGPVSFAPRVWTLGNNFVVTFVTSTASSNFLQYIPVHTVSPSTTGSVTTISSNITPGTVSFDGVIANNSLYLSWNGSGNSGIRAKSINQNLIQSSEVIISSTAASIVAVTADVTGSAPNIWTAGYFNGSSSGVIVATNSVTGSSASLTTLFSAKTFVSTTSAVVNMMTLSAQNNIATVYYQQTNFLPFINVNNRSDFISQKQCTSTGSLSAISTLARSVGLASKAFIIGSQSYVLTAMDTPYQPSYFLLNSGGGVVTKLAYQNASGYVTSGVPSVDVNGTVARVPYLFKDLIASVNKNTNVAGGVQTAGIYTQTGINLANIDFTTSKLTSIEAGQNLLLSSGMPWMYDGYKPVEHMFHIYPEPVEVIGSGTGSVAAGTYFVQATYEWSDNQGNQYRSAPSIPQSVTLGTSSGILVNVPTLRLTYKTDNPVKIVLYRWSTTQPVYYQTTSLTTPILNSTTIDAVSFYDTSSDATILGNNILYTNGGVLENDAFPAVKSFTLFDSRAWGIVAEDPNTLAFSKQVISGTPVEPSQLLTTFVSPISGAQGPTGPCTALAPMDEKLIIFKKNAIYYINGIGPDNTGQNSQYSEPIFITGTVGCSNQNSIVLIPSGLMFESEKGIWLLGRDLSTSYIGEQVEAFGAGRVLSAVSAPGTNHARFMLSTEITLVYDYFVGQWGTFTGIPGISATIYNGMHTFIDSYGRASQEQSGVYLDGTTPTTMAWTTGWLNYAGFQGYKRIYRAYVEGTYESPHVFTFGVAYDFDSNISQLVTVTPDNFTGTYGSGSFWGSGPTYGGVSTREQYQINFQQQTCQSFQLSFKEYFDPTQGQVSGPGITMSGVTTVVGISKGFPRNIPAKHMVG